MSKAISSLDRSSVRMIADDIEIALAKVAKRYGVKIEVGNSSFSPTNCTTKINISTVAKNGTVMTKEATDFNRYASSFGITGYKLGDTFEHRFQQYKIIGLKPRARKYPVLAEDVNTGYKFKFPASILGGRLY